MATVRFAAYPAVPDSNGLRVIAPSQAPAGDRVESAWITSVEAAEDHAIRFAARMASGGRKPHEVGASGIVVCVVWPPNKRTPRGWAEANAAGRLKIYVEFPAVALH